MFKTKHSAGTGRVNKHESFHGCRETGARAARDRSDTAPPKEDVASHWRSELKQIEIMLGPRAKRGANTWPNLRHAVLDRLNSNLRDKGLTLEMAFSGILE